MAARRKTDKTTVEPKNESSFEIQDTENQDTIKNDDNGNDDEIDMDENLLDDENIIVPSFYDKSSPDVSTNRTRGVPKGYMRELVEPDFELKCNLNVLQLINQFDDHKFPTTEQLADIPGIGVNFLRRLRMDRLSLNSDLYKCLVLADTMGVELIGEKQPNERFCDNALFIRVPKEE